MKTILVPTDFSNYADNALAFAVNLTKKMQAKIILLHCFHVENNNAALPVHMVDKQLEAAKQKSNAHLKKLYHSLSSKHPIEFMSVNNLAVDAILETAEEKKVDLVIMGTQGVNGQLSRQIFGTNSSTVIEKAKCPVITIPNEAIHNSLQTICYASEYLNSDIDCLQNISEIAKLFEAKINVIHITQTNNENERKLLEDFKHKVEKIIAYQNIAYKILEGTNVEQRIETYLNEGEKVDLLVMSAHHRSLMDKLFGKSVTKIMSYYLKIPLMVFHHKRTSFDDNTDRTVAKLIF